MASRLIPNIVFSIEHLFNFRYLLNLEIEYQGEFELVFSNNKRPCKNCRTIRLFVLAAIPLIVLIGTSQEFDLPNWDYHRLIGDLFLGVLLLVLAWRVYKDFWVKNKR